MDHQQYRPDLMFSANTTYDSTGIMVGAQAADMRFPASTRFIPYVVLRNTTAKPLAVRLAANAQLAPGAEDVGLGSLLLAPQETRQLDMAEVLAASTLNGFNGYVNLRTSFAGSPADLLEESGSVDRTLNYVFEVPPRLEQATGPASLNYWSTTGDTDTMFTLYNYGEAPQDVILTFEHQEGKYEMPVHLGPHGSNSFSVAQLIASGAPDRNGNTLPATIVQGSLRIAGMSGSHKERLTVAIAGGIFNSRTGTCSYPCFDCIGGEYADGSPNAFDLPWSDGNGIGLVAFSDGSQEDYTSQASFSSEDTGVASQGGNQTTGQGLGSTFIDGSVEVTGNDVRRTCCGIAGLWRRRAERAVRECR